MRKFLTMRSALINEGVCWLGIVMDRLEIKRQCCDLLNFWRYENWCFWVCRKQKLSFHWTMWIYLSNNTFHVWVIWRVYCSVLVCGKYIYIYFSFWILSHFTTSAWLNHTATQGNPTFFTSSFRFPAFSPCSCQFWKVTMYICSSTSGSM